MRGHGREDLPGPRRGRSAALRFPLLAIGLWACPAIENDSAAPRSPYGLEARPDNPNCLAMARPTADLDLELTAVFTDLSISHPVALSQNQAGLWFLAEQTGRLLTFSGDDSAETQAVALDLSTVVNSGFETGLLGLALHPDFAENGEIYLNYTLELGGETHSRISRFRSTDGGWSFGMDSEEVILELQQPYDNHNGGQLAFGSEGLLYASFGDGGAAGDPLGNGQDPFTLLGSILRIDVDSGSPYSIPSNNPFANGQNGAPEVYAYGFRNVWRFTLDPETDDLWAGDVGQYTAEEVDRVESGGNYGWNIMEGDECYDEKSCDSTGLIPPVITYPNTTGASVVVGPVYRGSALPDLVGTLLFSDFYDGKIRALVYDSITGEAGIEVLAESSSFISSFGEGLDGEIYALDYYGSRILSLVPSSTQEVPEKNQVPDRLSETGCMDPDQPSLPGPGLIPYGVQHPLWSDGATKQRWMALPDGESIDVTSDGDWNFPIGSVLVKQFSVDSLVVETRLFMRHSDGNWAGYSYAWNEEGTEATLLNGAAQRDFSGTSWRYPSRSDCLQCHTPAAGGSLGLETVQLNGFHDYESGSALQLLTLEHIGVVDLSADLSSLPSLSPRSDQASSARSLLHVNCSGCHRPESTGGGELDLRWDRKLDEMGGCGEPPEHGDIGVSSGLIIAPGDPARSILSQRMHATDHARMPPLGTVEVDVEGVASVDAWIGQLQSCAD